MTKQEEMDLKILVFRTNNNISDYELESFYKPIFKDLNNLKNKENKWKRKLKKE